MRFRGAVRRARTIDRQDEQVVHHLADRVGHARRDAAGQLDERRLHRVGVEGGIGAGERAKERVGELMTGRRH